MLLSAHVKFVLRITDGIGQPIYNKMFNRKCGVWHKKPSKKNSL